MDNDNIHSAYRGDIFYADLEPVRGSEQGGVRPVLIIQNDIGNRHSPTVIVAAITSRIKHHRLNREEAAVPLKADIAHTIFLEEVARHPAFIKRLYLCIFGIEINPIV